MRRQIYLAAALGAAVLGCAYGAALPFRTADAADPGISAPVDGTEPGYAVYVNGAGLTLDSPARLTDSTMLVPVRNIAEALGAAVSYEANTQTVTAVKGELTVTFKVGSRDAVKNGVPFLMDTAARKDGDVTMVPLRFFSEAFGTAVKWDGVNRRVSVDHEDHLLPSVGSYANLQKLLKENRSQTDSMVMEDNGFVVMGAVPAAKEAKAGAAPAAQAAADTAKASAAAEYSGTNVQVAGVDEADVVKTDGRYIYQVNKDRIIITEAYPADRLRLTATLPMSDYGISPSELYVDGDRLTVVGMSYIRMNVEAKPFAAEKKKAYLPYGGGKVKTVVFDISDKANPKSIKEVEMDGRYVSSRKIGGSLYLIANQSINHYEIMNGNSELPAPAYRDSAVSESHIQADYSKIRYFPDSPLESYMLVAGIDTVNPEKKAQVSVYLGSAQNVYASDRNLYVTTSLMKPVTHVLGEGANTAGGAFKDTVRVNRDMTSVAYKFRLDQGQVVFAAKGEVPGTLLNQFSMDEHNGYFRIATTKGDMWRNDEFTSKNNVYVLDESMNITGKLEDIAPGERIYSVRFMGGRGYMVTFKKVDPLFVLDLSTPSQPSVLGKLKIPGYSDYLHPYDETHLIGFGKDAVEVVNERNNGTGVSAPSDTAAYYQGMKLAMFDVSDVSNPKELFKTGIGDRGTDSELLHNHKALLFSKEKNLLAFPVTVMEVSPELKRQQGATAYGQFAFQGAYVYRVDLTEGFKLRGSISHLNQEQQLKAGDNWYDADRSVNRVLYIGDTLYTLSPSEIRANELDSLKEKERLPLP